MYVFIYIYMYVVSWFNEDHLSEKRPYVTCHRTGGVINDSCNVLDENPIYIRLVSSPFYPKQRGFFQR